MKTQRYMKKRMPKIYILFFLLFFLGVMYFNYCDTYGRNIIPPLVLLVCLLPPVIRGIYLLVRPVTKPAIGLALIVTFYIAALVFFYQDAPYVKYIGYVTLVYLIIPAFTGTIVFAVTKKKEDIVLTAFSFTLFLILPVIYFTVKGAIGDLKYDRLSRSEKIEYLIRNGEMPDYIEQEARNYILSAQHLQSGMYVPIKTIYENVSGKKQDFRGITVIHWYYIKQENKKKVYCLKFTIDQDYRATGMAILPYKDKSSDISGANDTSLIKAAIRLKE